MKSRLLIVSVFIFLCSTAWAADPHIGYIKNFYADAVKMTNNRYEDISYKLVTEQIYGGTGEMHTEIQFYHKLVYQDAEYHDPYNAGAQPQLIFVTVDYNIAAGSAEHAEYLFDPKTEELLFFYRSSDSGFIKTESRMYFKNGELIRIKINNDNGKIVKDDNFNAENKESAASVLEKAQKYKQTFKNIYFLDRIEKWNE